jgi:hypothetical protein
MPDSTLAEIHANESERPELEAVQALVGRSPAGVRVRVADNEVELPHSLVRVLLEAAGALSTGSTVAIVAEEAEVSPAEAARLLGVSRQYVDRLLSNDLLPVRRLPHSSYRKIPVRAVLAHKQARERKQTGIHKIIDEAIAAGLQY